MNIQAKELVTHNNINQNDNVILEYTNIRKTFIYGHHKVHAIKNVSLKVKCGVITGLTGPDGAGKSTLMRLAVGLLEPDSGDITALGINVKTNYMNVQAEVGYMPQRFGLYEDLSVQENLDLYADLHGVQNKSRSERFRELLEVTGLAPFTSRLAGRLSGGMKQKLGLACTLIRKPRLLLLDEPTVGVDPVSRRELWGIIQHMVKQEGTSVLISTAYMDEAERCETVVLIYDGEILGNATPSQFKQSIQGKSYKLTVSGIKKRTVQERISDYPSLIDVTIHNGQIRLVLDNEASIDIEKLIPGIKGATIEPSPPSLEDSFISILQRRQKKNKSKGKKSSGQVIQNNNYTSEESAIEVVNVKRRFGSFYAVKGVTFQVKKGEVFGLLGANGAGKTTTFRMLCGLLPASEGKLQVAGVNLRDAPSAARSHIGYMSQKFSLYGNLSVKQNLQFFSSAYGLSGSNRSRRIEWALDEFELSHVSDSNSMDLPLGLKQRLAMACALMHQPDIMFLDEPTSGVDLIARRVFWNRINLLAEEGVTILVTTHFMEEAEYCDRVAIMSEGEILIMGTPDEINAGQRTTDIPDLNMEDAFIGLVMGRQNKNSS